MNCIEVGNCVIFPIPLWVSAADKSAFTYLANLGQSVCVTGYVWYIEGSEEKVLVDAGADVEYLCKVRGHEAYQIQTLESGLDKVGVSVSDIRLIIQTHLHADHIVLASRFPKARILVQKDELEFVRNPHCLFEDAYVKEFVRGLKLEVVEGDTQVSREISVLLTPGHTPGSQSVSIKTEQGTAIISGFCAIRENFGSPVGKMSSPVIAPAVHTNLFQAYDSMLRIKKEADIIVPLHDPEFLAKSRIP
jgi:glyoxylase-like metal-dependent hydrolase (beta-lactamase superfamily II)